jgi:hypothetical protein
MLGWLIPLVVFWLLVEISLWQRVHECPDCGTCTYRHGLLFWGCSNPRHGIECLDENED